MAWRLAGYGLLLMVIAGCGSIVVNATLVPNVPTEVYVGEAAVQVYNFDALPDSPTILSLKANPPTLAYSAELRDASGNLRAVLGGGGGLEDTEITLPANSGTYEVRITTGSAAQGTVELIVTAQQRPKQEPLASQTAALVMDSTAEPDLLAGVCELNANGENGAPVHRTPDPTSEIRDVMPQGTRIYADARTSSADGSMWYRVRILASVAWIPAQVVTARGTCQELPVVTPNAPTDAIATDIPFNLPTAPFDADTYDIPIDEASGAAFAERVSYPVGDRVDRLWLTMPPAGANRVMTVRLICEGAGIEALRWGTPQNPALGCNAAHNLTFTPELTRHNLIVLIPEGSASSHVNYQLQANPSAPQDPEMFLFAMTKDTGGGVREAISYPNGDTTDTYVMQVEDFAPNPPEDQRTFAVYVACEGSNVASVRWGEPDTAAYRCNQAAFMQFSVQQPQSVVTVTLPPESASGYLTYTMTAVPVAPADGEAFVFTADRSLGGQFAESISSPQGDAVDTVQFSISNLLNAPPHNFREVQLTLLCSGAGVEQVRWGVAGDAALRCGGTARVPVLFNAGAQTVTVAVGDGNAYVNYTLVAQPSLP